MSLPDERLIRDVARRAAGWPGGRVVEWRLEPFTYPRTNPSTISFQRLHAVLADKARQRSVYAFVKTIGSMRHSPVLEFVPPHLREAAIARFPWHVEADVYASHLLDDLPDGLRAPAVYAVEELPDDRSPALDRGCDNDRGRVGPGTLQAGGSGSRGLAARWSVERMDAELPRRAPFLRDLIESRIRLSAIPMIRDARSWVDPAVGEVVDKALSDELLALWNEAPAILSALERLPHTGAHGDACPQDLLASEEGFAAIDWGMAGLHPIGLDLGQLLAGRTDSTGLAAHDLPAVHEAILSAYLEGMKHEGADPDIDAVRTGYVGSLLLRSAFTALPFELLMRPSEPELAPIFASRASYARFLLDLRSELPATVA